MWTAIDFEKTFWKKFEIKQTVDLSALLFQNKSNKITQLHFFLDTKKYDTILDNCIFMIFPDVFHIGFDKRKTGSFFMQDMQSEWVSS